MGCKDSPGRTRERQTGTIMNQMHVITVFVETAEMSSFRNAARKRKVIGHRLRELSGLSKLISSDGSSNVLHGGLCPAAHRPTTQPQPTVRSAGHRLRPTILSRTPEICRPAYSVPACRSRVLTTCRHLRRRLSVSREDVAQNADADSLVR